MCVGVRNHAPQKKRENWTLRCWAGGECEYTTVVNYSEYLLDRLAIHPVIPHQYTHTYRTSDRSQFGKAVENCRTQRQNAAHKSASEYRARLHNHTGTIYVAVENACADIKARIFYLALATLLPLHHRLSIRIHAHANAVQTQYTCVKLIRSQYFITVSLPSSPLSRRIFAACSATCISFFH